MMQTAIAFARRGEGFVEPNPMVGCVITKRGRVIGRGYHERFGAPHAEVNALAVCRESPAGGTVYVSLEPCAHHAKTPPCCDALIKARIARVVIGARDPNKTVRGGGARRLRAAGIDVHTGVCRETAQELIAPFATWVTLRRPFVIAKWAQSLDGKMATGTGDSKWISCEASRRRVHRLRARVDAILVGSGTVIADDPLLTARNVRLRRVATRVVLDGRLRLPIGCALVKGANAAPTIVMTTREKTSAPKARRLMRLGVELIACRKRADRLSIKDVLRHLAQRDVTNLLVEGGPTVLASLVGQGLVDEAHVYVAPILIGAGPSVLSAGNGVDRVCDAYAPSTVHTSKSGVDTLVRMRFATSW